MIGVLLIVIQQKKSSLQNEFINKIKDITSLNINSISRGYYKVGEKSNNKYGRFLYNSYVIIDVGLTLSQINKQKEYFKEEIQKIINSLVHFKDEDKQEHL